MNDAKELERVRAIHWFLDGAYIGVWVEGVVIDRLNDTLTFGGHTYTAAEIAAWPEMKAKMLEKLRTCSAAYWVRGEVVKRDCAWGWLPETLREVGADELARGFVMYRETLIDGDGKAEDTGVTTYHELNKLPEPKRADPYEQYRSELARRIVSEGWGGGAENLEQVTARYTGERSTNLAARLRNIAALKSEMDRPLPQKHPSEGRSDRVTGYRRW